MVRMQRSIGVLSSLIMTACSAIADRAPTAPPQPGAPRLAMAAAHESNVTGSVHIEAFLTTPNRYEFSAIRHRDGRVTGQIEFERPDVAGHADVNCFTVVGNTARVSGIVRESTMPNLVGAGMFFYVVDNGEGANDPPDQASPVFFSFPAEESLAYCLAGPPFINFPEEQGNIQVHD